MHSRFEQTKPISRKCFVFSLIDRISRGGKVHERGGGRNEGALQFHILFSRSNAPLVRGAKNARLDGQRNTLAKSIAYDHVSMARRGNRWVIGGTAFVFKHVRAIFRQ